MAKIILASASPRRAELLKNIKVDFEIIPSKVDEVIDIKDSPIEIVKKLSMEKAMNVVNRLEETAEECLVVGADTIVVTDKILGKPISREDAYEMLSLLKGKPHKVVTGITIIKSSTFETISDAEVTNVYMKNLSNREINSYLDTGEPFDKAGAYGVQGIGGLLIEKIEGCYFNVVGLPLAKLSDMLGRFDINLL